MYINIVYCLLHLICYILKNNKTIVQRELLLFFEQLQ